MANIVAISVGSNIYPEKNIALARQLISASHRFIQASDFVITKPLGFEDQDDFTNGAFLIETTATQEELIIELKNIERQCGRVKTENKNGPRTIDLDITVWNNSIVDPDYYKREFIKNAIEQLLPDLHSPSP